MTMEVLSMNQIANVKREFQTKQWIKIIQDCKSSGMTAASWCSKNNVNIKTYYYWLRKMRLMACNSETGTVVLNEKRIVPLSVNRPSASVGASITIHMNSTSVDIRNDASKEIIYSVLEALKAIC